VTEAFGTFDFGLSPEDESRARKLHESAIVVDMLCQGPCGHRAFRPEWDDEIRARLAVDANLADAWNFVVELPIRHALAETDGGVLEDCWRTSGVTAGTRERDFVTWRDILASLAIANAQFGQLPWFRRALSGEDIRAAKRDGQIAGFVNSQDTVGLGTDLSLLEDARSLGLAMIQLTYNSQNFVGTGCTERNDSGLSHFGVRFVERCTDLGMLVDTSHCGRQTTLDACKVSRRPVIASHTSAAALYEVDRAKSDEELKALADTGGVVGVYAVPFFLGPGKEVTVEALLDHVDYLVQLVGWEHVGIGTDWPLMMSEWALEHVAQPWTQAFGFRPEHNVDALQTLVGFDDYRDFPNITRGLVARGYSDEQVRGILGENFCRVFDEVAG
jgi:membrane dipeptidase